MTGEFDSDVIRLRYNSLTTPSSVIDHHIPSNRRAVRKVGFEAWGGGG
jgi:protease II